MFADLVERLQRLDFFQQLRVVDRLRAFDRQDHLVLVGVLQRDELEHLGLITAGFEVQRTQAVGDHFRLLAQVQAVLQHRLEQHRALDLQTNLFVAARRAHDDRRAGADAGVDRVIGGDVAGMQGDHHVQFARRDAAHIPAFEHQPRVFQARSGGVAQGHHVFAQLDTRHFALGLEGVAQVIVDSEGQVALARTKVGNTHRPVQFQR